MNKKLIFTVVILLVFVAIFYLLYKPQQGKFSEITINGVLIKNEWKKSLESYCSQGSDYFTLKTNDEELILEFKPVYSDTQISQFSGKNVSITGEKKERKIQCPEGSQCPVTPKGVFTCEVFKVNNIK